MAYKPQFCAGTTKIAENRRNFMNPAYKLQKIRDISDEDVVLIMGHRAPGAVYPTTHPPLSEAGEPKCPVRKLVTPLDGAKTGDRVRYIQFADSVLVRTHAPISPLLHGIHPLPRCRPGYPLGTSDCGVPRAGPREDREGARYQPSALTRPARASGAARCTATRCVSTRTA